MSAALPLVGHKDHEVRLVSAFTANRLHHAWILQGPSGIGKSRLARRLSACFLGADGPDAPKSDPVMRLVLSGAHPDMKWIEREADEKGKLRQDITVDQIRNLVHFLRLHPAMARWRVAVIDSLDDMNTSSMNALLKNLEEPPDKAILILVFHTSRPLLATIRSRCAILKLGRLSDDETRTVLNGVDGDKALAFKLARGRPGHGLTLAATGGAHGVRAAENLLKSIDAPKPGIVANALQTALDDTGALDAFVDTLMDWIEERAQDNPVLAKTWLELNRTRIQAATLDLTPLQTATKLFTILRNDIRDTRHQDHV